MTTATGMTWAGLVSELELVLQVFDENQILILQCRRTGRYVQLFVNEPGSLHVEVSSNTFLDEDGALSEGQATSLLERGWKAPAEGGSPNYSTDLRGPSATSMAAKLAVRTLAETLGASSPADLDYDAFQFKGGPMVLPPLRLERMNRGAEG